MVASSSGNLLSREGAQGGEGPPGTRATQPCPPAVSPAGRQREKGSPPHRFPGLGRLERNAMSSCFQLTSPHQQPSTFLRPGVKTATGEGWGGAWRELRWWQALELKGGPQEPGGPSLRPQDPTRQAPGLGTDPSALSQPLGGGRGKSPHPKGRLEKAPEASGKEVSRNGGRAQA